MLEGACTYIVSKQNASKYGRAIWGTAYMLLRDTCVHPCMWNMHMLHVYMYMYICMSHMYMGDRQISYICLKGVLILM